MLNLNLSEHNQRIKYGTANSLLGSASFHILANNYHPLKRALVSFKNAELNSNFGVIKCHQIKKTKLNQIKLVLA